MKFLAMIIVDEQDQAAQALAYSPAMMGEYLAYGEMLRTKGAEAGNQALQPSATATTIRIRNGKTIVSDGPFAETKEHIGGYYLIEAKDRDDAIALASKCPGAKHGVVEVRPCVDFSQMG